MKLAPWTTAAGVALLMAVTAGAMKPELEDQVVALDFTGIDRLEVVAEDADVVLGGDKPATARLDASAFGDPDQSPRLIVRRKGRTLWIDLVDADGDNLVVHAPTHVRTLVMRGGEVVAHAPMGAIEVRTTADLEWEGDARSLRIVDIGPATEKECAAYEPASIGIDEGEVGELFASTVAGRVLLRSELRAARTTLALGPEAHFSVHHVRVLPPLVLQDLPAGRCRPRVHDEDD